ncbi:YrdB family protein [Mycetocola zhujimingii]|uniref:4-amino-4-deoxy-L-arabinose transferase n=1 Tax=Mycetocola zhujimingii TaxID=2079792 RepID=A0A2U1TDM4_9MICO|nr:YrdB family protein [Mycetocola zhujimingii]PWC06992.1 4-amino-4-deoxy-L-arabinose transferase [Mycetocola zhujimingii]
MSDTSQPSVTPNDILRLFLELFAIVSLGIWGFLAWSLPWNFVIGIGAPVIAILLWGLFRSPKAVFHIDPYGKALIELAVMGAAALAWWDLGVPFVALVFGVVAVISGVVNGRREFSR